MAWTVYNPRAARTSDERLQLTLEARGGLGLSPLAMEALGYPRHIVLVFDPESYSIMLRPQQHPSEHLQSVSRDPRKSGRDAGHVSGKGFCVQFGILPRKTVRLNGRQEGNGLIFALPAELRARREQPEQPEQPNSQRTLAGTTA